MTQTNDRSDSQIARCEPYSYAANVLHSAFCILHSAFCILHSAPSRRSTSMSKITKAHYSRPVIICQLSSAQFFVICAPIA
jgi:hypothetical protein